MIKVPYKIVTLQEVFKQLNSIEELYFDTETDGLYGTIELAQFFQPCWDEVLLVRKPNPFDLVTILGNTTIVMHNASYDISTLQDQLGKVYYCPSSIEDTFYLARLHYYTKEKFSLDKVMTYCLGYDPYEVQDLNKTVLQKSNWSGELSEDQLLYAATDVFYLPAVYSQVSEQEETYSYKLDIHTLKHCLNFQNNGMPVDQGELQKAYKENLARIAEIDLPINSNSWKQVRPYIDHDESDDLALIKLKLQGNERAGAVQETRKTIKQNSFLSKFDHTSADGRIYGKFLPSTRSGRLASKDQNLQQIPRKLKKVFGYSTEDDRVLIYSDYAQLELRCICAITAEHRMEKLFRSNEDLHGYTTKLIFGENFAPEERQLTKTGNFSLLYGSSPRTFGSILLKQAELWWDEHKLKIFKKNWLNLWPAIAAWQEAGISAWRNGIPWATPMGRRYVAKLMTDQLNIQNQGFGAEVAKLALHYMMPKLRELSLEIKLINFIHDSYILDCPKDEELWKAASKIVAECMQKAWFASTQGVKIKDLPMPIEVFVGYNWGRIEKDYLYKYELEGMTHAKNYDKIGVYK